MFFSLINKVHLTLILLLLDLLSLLLSTSLMGVIKHAITYYYNVWPIRNFLCKSKVNPLLPLLLLTQNLDQTHTDTVDEVK